MSLIKAILPFWLAVGYHTWGGAGERLFYSARSALLSNNRGLFPFALAVLIPLNMNRAIVSADLFPRSLHLSLKDIVRLWQGALRMFFTIHQMLNTCSDLSAHSCQICPRPREPPAEGEPPVGNSFLSVQYAHVRTKCGAQLAMQQVKKTH